MKKATKTYLILAILSAVPGLIFAFDVVKVRDAVWLYTLLPLGAIFFGLFLICKVLEKESTNYDAEQLRISEVESKHPAASPVEPREGGVASTAAGKEQKQQS